jgi:uncharacterized repeat protein (TIGR03803 family)
MSADIEAVTAPCEEALAGFTLRVTDSGGRFSQAILVVSTGPAPPPGTLPGSTFSGVVPGPDSRLYGTTYDCGNTNDGTLYVYSSGTQNATQLYNLMVRAMGRNNDELVFDAMGFKALRANRRPSGAGTIFTDPANRSYHHQIDFVGFTHDGPPVRSNATSTAWSVRSTRKFNAWHRRARHYSSNRISTGAQMLTLGAGGMPGMLFGGQHPTQRSGCGAIFRLKAVLPGDLDEQFQVICEFQGNLFRGCVRTTACCSTTSLWSHAFRPAFRLNQRHGLRLHFEDAVVIIDDEGADGRLYLGDYGGGPDFAGNVFSIAKDGTGFMSHHNFS